MLDKLQEYNLSELSRVNERISKESSRFSNQIRKNQEDIDTLHNTIRNVVSIGADVVHNMGNDRSWAVICIEGNYNVVKFVDLHGADYHSILNYLKQFEGSRMCIDAPGGKWFEKEFKWL